MQLSAISAATIAIATIPPTTWIGWPGTARRVPIVLKAPTVVTRRCAEAFDAPRRYIHAATRDATRCNAPRLVVASALFGHHDLTAQHGIHRISHVAVYN